MIKGLRILWVLLSLFIAFYAEGQSLDRSAKEVIYKFEKSGFLEFRSNGWGAGYRIGKFKTGFINKTWEFSFNVVKDWKQVKTFVNSQYGTSSRFYYGKLINFYNLKALRGSQKVLTTKPYWGGVEFRRIFEYGINIGIGKPIYVYIYNYDEGNIITLEKFDPEKYDNQDIYRAGPFSKGLNELQWYPAASFKYAISAEYGNYTTLVKAIEVGATADIYPIPVQIMGGKDPSYFLASIYLAFHFGKRFNK